MTKFSRDRIVAVLPSGGTGGTGETDPEIVRDTIANALVAGDNITITPNDAANTITIAATSGGGATDPEVVRDTIAAALVAGANVTITPNDGADTITISATDTNTTDPEVVRDTIAASLVGGANVTITHNDAANTITIAAASGSGVPPVGAEGEVLTVVAGVPDWAPPTGGGGGTVGNVVNVADVLDGGAADHMAAFKSIVETNGPGYTYFIPSGFTLKLTVQDYHLGNAIYWQDYMGIVGEGAGSLISVTGFSGLPYNPNDPTDWHRAVFAVDYETNPGTFRGGFIRDLTVDGNWAGPYTTHVNAEGSVIKFWTATGTVVEGFHAQRVTFQKIQAFPMSSHGIDDGTVIEHCTMINNDNDLNMNGNNLTIRNNRFHNAMGVEASGYGVRLTGNTLTGANTLNVGGNYAQGASARAHPGVQVTNNVFLGDNPFTYAIQLAQSSPDVLVSGNYIEGATVGGIFVQHTATTGPDAGHIISHNHVLNCGTPAGEGFGIVLQGDGHRVIGNRIYNRTPLASDPFPLGSKRITSGIYLDGCTNPYFADNTIDLRVGGNRPFKAYPGPGAVTGMRFGPNVFHMRAGYDVFEASDTYDSADASHLGMETVAGTGTGVTLLLSGRKYVWSGSSASTVTLPKAGGLNGKTYQIVNKGTAALTVYPYGAEAINGAGQMDLDTQHETVTLESDGTNWQIVAHYDPGATSGGGGGGGGDDTAYQALITGTTGVVSYWPLTETSGTTIDDAVGAINGTLSGSGNTLATSGIPVGGTAISLTGPGGINLGDNYDFTGTTAFSLEVWIQTTAADTWQSIWTKRSGGTGYHIEIDDSEKITASRMGNVTASPAGSVNPGASWYHVVNTYDGTYWRMYINGVATGFINSGSQTGNTTNLFIGGSGDGFGLKGKIAHPAVYNVALSTATIQAHYNAGMGL